MILNKNIILVFIILFCTNNAFAENNYKANVIKIFDGDSLLVKKDKIIIEIRLSSIDAPEYSQSYGKECKKVLSDLILYKKVDIISDGKDRYGRTIAVLNYNNKNINQELVKLGCAWAYKRYLKDKSLIGFERRARADKIGLWSQPKEKIIPPWNARQH